MAHAPLVEQDGDNYAADLPDITSDLFLAAGLDGTNQLEIAREFSLFAQRLFLVTSSEPRSSFSVIASAATP